MRGFPLINSLLVIAFFAVAWWPLRQATSARASVPKPVVPEREVEAEEGRFSGEIRITASHPLKRVMLGYQGTELLEVDAQEAGLEIEEALPAFLPDPEGIEFWVEAEFSAPPSAGQRGVLRIELVPDDVEQETTTVTLWGEEEEVKIEDAAFFPPAKTP